MMIQKKIDDWQMKLCQVLQCIDSLTLTFTLVTDEDSVLLRLNGMDY